MTVTAGKFGRCRIQFCGYIQPTPGGFSSYRLHAACWLAWPRGRPAHLAIRSSQVRPIHLLPGEGHLTLTVTAIGHILDDLLGLAGLS